MKGLKCLVCGKWWNAAGTRAIKTAAQSAVASIAVKNNLGYGMVCFGRYCSFICFAFSADKPCRNTRGG